MAAATPASQVEQVEIEATSPFSVSLASVGLIKEFAAAGPGCAAANGLLNGLETTKVKLQLHNNLHRIELTINS